MKEEREGYVPCLHGHGWWFHSSEDREIGLRTVDVRSFYMAYKCGTVPFALDAQHLTYCRHANKSNVLMLCWTLRCAHGYIIKYLSFCLLL